MDIIAKAGRISVLKNDETFKEVIKDVRHRQVEVFLNTSGTDEDRSKAHNIICALEQIEDYMLSIIDGAKIQEKRNK